MTRRDRREFESYLARCTDSQVLGVHERERAAGRYVYAQLAQAEAFKRGLTYCESWLGVSPVIKAARP